MTDDDNDFDQFGYRHAPPPVVGDWDRRIVAAGEDQFGIRWWWIVRRADGSINSRRRVAHHDRRRLDDDDDDGDRAR